MKCLCCENNAISDVFLCAGSKEIENILIVQLLDTNAKKIKDS